MLANMKKATVIVASICRAALSPDLLAKVTESGVMPLSPEDLPPRQIKLRDQLGNYDVVMRWHRDAYIPTISRAQAQSLVSDEVGDFVPQSLLTYTREDYLADPDVVGQEHTRVSRSGADLVVVAVIGDSRSTLAVCRNIVSGCQDMDALEKDAAAAVEAANVFLIEY